MDSHIKKVIPDQEEEEQQEDDDDNTFPTHEYTGEQNIDDSPVAPDDDNDDGDEQLYQYVDTSADSEASLDAIEKDNISPPECFHHAEENRAGTSNEGSTTNQSTTLIPAIKASTKSAKWKKTIGLVPKPTDYSLIKVSPNSPPRHKLKREGSIKTGIFSSNFSQTFPKDQKSSHKVLTEGIKSPIKRIKTEKADKSLKNEVEVPTNQNPILDKNKRLQVTKQRKKEEIKNSPTGKIKLVPQKSYTSPSVDKVENSSSSNDEYENDKNEIHKEEEGVDSVSTSSRISFSESNDGHSKAEISTTSSKKKVLERKNIDKSNAGKAKKPSTFKRIIEKHFVTPRNFNFTSWEYSYMKLSLSRCDHVLTLARISKSSETLTVLNFFHTTLFTNIVNFLRSCPNLQILSFANITLDEEKKRFKAREFELLTHSLLELNIHNWTNKLGKSEYWLIDFFNRGVNLTSIKSFAFHGVDSLVTNISGSSKNKVPKQITIIPETQPSVISTHSRLHQSSNASSNINTKKGKNLKKSATVSTLRNHKIKSKYSIIPPRSNIAFFLMKNGGTLKNLSIGGRGFRLCGTSTSTSQESEMAATELTDLQLDSIVFGIDTPGIKTLLSHQRALKTLSCKGFTRSINQDMNDQIVQFIQANSSTLISLGIFPCIVNKGLVASSNNNSNNNTGSTSNQGQSPLESTPPDLHALSCQIFSQCSLLENLYLNITVTRSESKPGSACGTVIGLASLPHSLVHVEIYNEEFKQSELDGFFRKIGKFRKLERLVLSASPSKNKMAYTIPLTAVKTLMELPRMRNVDFFGGKMNNLAATKDYVKSSARKYHHKFQITIMTSSPTNPNVSFHKYYPGEPVETSSSTTERNNQSTSHQRQNTNTPIS